jgi:hypothetical protein
VDPHGVWKLMNFGMEIDEGHEFLGWFMNFWKLSWKLMNFCKWEMEIDDGS